MSIDRNYVSDMDKFLEELDKDPNTMSESREQEAEKYKQINQLRDEANEDSKNNSIWKDF
ncbi:MAG: hypothetical protein HWE27_19035 [Gammaproteobacteria bacterium]|nr:hypothetical protein [Gammaproteobacteria bacterium]